MMQMTRVGVPTFVGGPVTISKLEFLDRFTDEELIAIRTAAKTDPAIDAWLYRFEQAQEIDVQDPRTVGGIQALEAAGLIAEGRSTEILQ